jgi:hypothetical protein
LLPPGGGTASPRKRYGRCRGGRSGVGHSPPASFGISLLPRERAERLVACQIAGGECPTPDRPPRHRPYRFLGEAVPPPGGNNPEGGDPPRYLLDFAIPALPPGEYAYVIWCDACRDGSRGSLVADPVSPRSRLTVRSAAGTAQASAPVNPVGKTRNSGGFYG